jgi:hypothetical protein
MIGCDLSRPHSRYGSNADPARHTTSTLRPRQHVGRCRGDGVVARSIRDSPPASPALSAACTRRLRRSAHAILTCPVKVLRRARQPFVQE